MQVHFNNLYCFKIRKEKLKEEADAFANTQKKRLRLWKNLRMKED